MEQYNTEIQERLRRLLIGYLDNGLNAQEEAELMHWANLRPLNQKVLSDLGNANYRQSELQKMGSIDIDAALQKTKSRRYKNTRRPFYTYISVAASLVIIASAALFIFNNKEKAKTTSLVVAANVQPGGNRATLTLSSGKQIDLTGAGIGNIAAANGVNIKKSADGIISYEGNANIRGTNTITTPNGGQYRVLLPDGTQVWLNAASSLSYPLTFTGSQRTVDLTGEAYFEVSASYKNHTKQKMPFVVRTTGQQVQVLGTHFNINAYSNEHAIVTTLEEGSVQVTTDKGSIVLKPGKKAVNRKGTLSIAEADLQTELAWKEGKIYFRNSDIRAIMRQVARWYNLDIAYEGKVSTKLFNGGVSRSSTLSTLLKVLQESNIHFKIEDGDNGRKKLIVMPD